MKVALIVEWLDATRGGAETSTGQFIEHLLDLGLTVEVFTRSRTPSRPNLKVHTLDPSSLWPGMRTLAFCRAAGKATANGFDIVHALAPVTTADLYQPRGGTYAETFARNLALRESRAGRAAKALVETTNRKRRSLLALERRMFAPDSPVEVVAISDYVVRQLIDHYDLAPQRIHKVFNGVDPDPTPDEQCATDRQEIRAAFNIAPEKTLAISVAHNFRLKGVPSTLNALGHLHRTGRSPQLQVLIVGKQHLGRWHARVRQLGLDDVVLFPGPTQRIRAFYHAADFLIHPTFYDPCSRVVLEARASGLPVITTRFDGAAEVVSEPDAGFVLTDPANTEQLANRIEQLAKKRPARNTPAAGEFEHGMRRHAEQIVQLYGQILQKKGKP